MYYFVDDEFLIGQVEQDEAARQRLAVLIEAGFASSEVSQEDGRARMRATIDRYKNLDA